MAHSSHYKKLNDLFRSFSPSFSTWEIFQDFIEMGAISLSNAVDISKRDIREKQYLDTVKKYKREDVDKFPEMFATLVLAMEQNPSDVLGKMYCELGLGNKWSGQFFTPDEVSKMMAKMTIFDVKERIEQKGFITVQEPAIGAGGLIINLAMALKEEDINYQQTMLVTGIDVDIKSIYMAYIQLSLLHIPAILVHGNSLTLDVFDTWYTPAYIMEGWAFKRQKEKKAQFIALSTKEKTIELRPETYETLSLFG